MLPILPAVEAADNWTDHKEVKQVKTNREWKVNFSDIATSNKIKEITVESNGKNIPVDVTYNNTKTVKVKPKQRYLSGKKHTLKIELANGKKDKMDFTTAIEDFGDNARIYTDEVIKGTVSKGRYYSIIPTEDGELTLKGTTSNKKMSLYLYDVAKEKGELFGFTEEVANPALTIPLKKNTLYYVKVIATGDYQLATSLKSKVLSAEEALQAATAAVNTLPAPMDVMEKHQDDIDQAKTLIAVARLFQADTLQIERLEKKIAALEDVIKPLEIVNVAAVSAKTFEVQFNRAIDTDIATFKLDGNLINRKEITWNANRTIATVTTAKALGGEHKVEVSLPLMDPLLPPKPLEIDGEKVTTIEILGDTAVRVAGDQVTIGYRALNQYGEEMENPGLTATATGSITASTSSIKFEEGRLLIPIGSAKLEDGSTFTLKLSKGTVGAEKQIKVSAKSSVYEMNILRMETNSKEKLIKETTDLKKDEFYLIVEAKDQFGTLIKEENELTDAFTITSTNSNVVGVAKEFEDHKKEAGLFKLALKNPEAGSPTVGKTTIVLTTKASNKKSEFPITVGEGARVDTFTLDIPERVTAGSNLEITLTAQDKDGDDIKDLEIIKGSVSGITWTTKPSIIPTVEKSGNKFVLKFKGEDIKEGNLEITGVSSTNKKMTETITISEKAVPTTWEWKETKEPSYEFIAGKSWDPITLTTENITAIDQYDKVLSDEVLKESGYVLKANTGDKAVKITNRDKQVTIEPKAVGKANVTISLYDNNNREIVGSRRVFGFTVEDDTGYIGYKLAPIGTLYDTEKDEYAQDVIVIGIINDKGAQVVLPIDAYELLKDDKTPGLKLEKGKISVDPDASFYYGNAMSLKMDIGVKIKSTGEVLTQEITVSKEKPKVMSLEVEKDELPYTLPTDDDKAVSAEWILEKAEISAVDQYGVKSKKLAFPDGTKIEPTITFQTVKGGQIFDGNGTKNAKITNFSAGSEVDATIATNGKVVTVKITMPEAHMPEVEEVAKSFNITDDEKKLTVETNNLLTYVKGFIKNDYYKISIKSVDDATIDRDGKIHPVQCNENCDGQYKDVEVTLIITHKTNPDLKKELDGIKFKVPKATKVILTEDSLGDAGSHVITGLSSKEHYTVLKNNKYYAIVENGKLSDTAYDSKEAAEKAEGQNSPKNGEITGLINGVTYKVEKVAPQKVLIDEESKGKLPNLKEEDRKITGLENNHRYVVSIVGEDSVRKYYGVLSNGKLHTQESESKSGASKDAGFLTGTEITGLTNGVTYKVEKAEKYEVVGLKAALVADGKNVKLEYDNIYTDNLKIEYRIDYDNWEELDEQNLLDKKVGPTSATIISYPWTPGKNYLFRLKIEDERYETNSKEVELMIPKLPVSERTIDIGQPKLNSSKPKKSEIQRSQQYDIESISWNFAGETFTVGTHIVAIKIKPGAEYTLDGLSSNSFIVEYATKTEYKREGEFGVITATFPKIEDPTSEPED